MILCVDDDISRKAGGSSVILYFQIVVFQVGSEQLLLLNTIIFSVSYILGIQCRTRRDAVIVII